MHTTRCVNRNWSQTVAIIPKLPTLSQITTGINKIHYIDVEYVRVHLQDAGGLPLYTSISLLEEFKDADIPAIPLLRQRVHKFKSLTMD